MEEYSAEINRKRHQKVGTTWKIGSVFLKTDNEEIRTYTCGTFTISGTILRITRGFHVGILTSVEFGQLPSYRPTSEADARTLGHSVSRSGIYTPEVESGSKLGHCNSQHGHTGCPFLHANPEISSKD